MKRLSACMGKVRVAGVPPPLHYSPVTARGRGLRSKCSNTQCSTIACSQPRVSNSTEKGLGTALERTWTEVPSWHGSRNGGCADRRGPCPRHRPHRTTEPLHRGRPGLSVPGRIHRLCDTPHRCKTFLSSSTSGRGHSIASIASLRISRYRRLPRRCARTTSTAPSRVQPERGMSG